MLPVGKKKPPKQKKKKNPHPKTTQKKKNTKKTPNNKKKNHPPPTIRDFKDPSGGRLHDRKGTELKKIGWGGVGTVEV